MKTITVSSSSMNVVSNLRSTDPRLKDIADWRIDAAHRDYSGSEDFGDDTKVFEWLPDDTEDNRFDYLMTQMGDLKRTIRELETYNATLVKEKRELSDQLHEAEAARERPINRKV